MTPAYPPASTPRPAGAFTLAETLVSIVIVGGLVVVALNTAGAAVVTQNKIGERARGQLLALDLMTEILDQAYKEPGSVNFGTDSQESGGSRANYDDVDDYDAWSSSPPEDKAGVNLPGLNDWTREVSVVWVTAADPAGLPSLVETGVKRVTVTVSRGGAEMASITAVRTGAGAAARPDDLTTGGVRPGFQVQ